MTDQATARPNKLQGKYTIIDEEKGVVKIVDTKLIVKCVNMHDDLIKACKIGLDYVISEEGFDKTDSKFIKEVLAKAQEK